MRVIFAPDSFKGSASATEVASALAEGWDSVRPGDELRLLPMADGGEGTLDAFELAVPESRRMPVSVTGPDGNELDAYWLLLPDGTGVVELASTSGLALMEALTPLEAHTLGFGQAIAAALDHGVIRLLLAIGGSSSTDGGAGALTALGARLRDTAGDVVPLGGGGLTSLASVDLTGLRELPTSGALVLSDVTNPLLGPLGAASIFGEQKGADAAQRVVLEGGLHRLAALLTAAVPSVNASVPGAGAAGGTGFGLLAWGAKLASGSNAVGEALGLPREVSRADVIVTGEGRFDAQSASGKVAGYVASLPRQPHASVLLVAGSVEAPTAAFAQVRSLSELAGGVSPALANPSHWIREAGASLAASF
jgi:glycerate kinase